MDLASVSSLRYWNTENILVWIVTRQISAAIAPGTWAVIKAESPEIAEVAESDLLQLLRAGSKLDRRVEIPTRYFRENSDIAASRRERWTDCFANRGARYNPSDVVTFFPRSVDESPLADGDCIALFQLTRWLSDRISLRMRRHASQLRQLESLLSICSSPRSGLRIRGWRNDQLAAEAQFLPVETICELQSSATTIWRSDGIEGSGRTDGGSTIIGGTLWSRLHLMKAEVTAYFVDFDGSQTLDAYAERQRLRLAEMLLASSDPAKSVKRGRPREHDLPALKRMHQLISAGQATSPNAAAKVVVGKDGHGAPGGGTPASKQTRLGNAYRRLRAKGMEATLGD